MSACVYCHTTYCWCGKCQCGNSKNSWGCAPDGHVKSSSDKLPHIDWPAVGSQKIKGIQSLMSAYPAYTDKAFSLGIYRVMKAAVPDTESIPYPCFVRPCPMVPRHGFVDSRVCKNLTELNQVIAETLAAEPDGEIMVCSPINAALNAVWTPWLLSIGEGNDGATAGKDTINFPLSGHSLSKDLLKKAAIAAGEMPYIEAVFTANGEYALTQLRSGTAMEGAGLDSIPNGPIAVTEVIKVNPTDSLLEWEAKTATYAGKVGLVVWHPGGSPTDHFSVHCRSHQIPLCITFEPTVGMSINAAPPPQMDPMEVLYGVAFGDQFPIDWDSQYSTTNQSAIYTLLATLHNSGQYGPGSSWWLGFGAALLLRYGSVALKGEARHLKDNIAKAHTPARDKVYQKALPYSLSRHRAAVPRLIHVHRYGNFSGSIGGIPWATCGAALGSLFDAVAALAADPSPDTLGALLRTYNIVVNQAHNGGWWLNKFASHDNFTAAQTGEIPHLMFATPFIWRVAKAWQEADQGILGKLVNKYAKWGPLNMRAPLPTEATLTIMPGMGGLGFTIKDRLLRSAHRPLVVPLDALVNSFPQLLKGKFYVSTGKEGMKLDFVGKDKSLTNVWTEPELNPVAVMQAKEKH